MTDAEKLAQLRLRLGEEEDDDVLTGYLSDAEALIRALAWRRDVPESLHNAVVRLAAVFYARRGAEGETSHQEGDVSRAMDGLPEDIRQEVLAYRLCRTGGSECG